MNLKNMFLRGISLVIASLFVATSVNASLIQGPADWNYNEYRSIASQGSLNSGSSFTMWQSFSTNAWMKYILSFSALAAPYNGEGSLEITVFDNNNLDSEPLLSEIIPFDRLLSLLSYDGMFTAMSDTSIIRFSLIFPIPTASGAERDADTGAILSQTSNEQTQADDSPINDQPNGSIITINNVEVTEVSSPSTLCLFLLVTFVVSVRKHFN